MLGSVVISHPSRILVSYQAALALQEADLLRRYETGFYYRPQGILAATLAVLPKPLRDLFEKELKRREQAGLHPRYVHSQNLLDFLYALSNRMGWPASWSEAALTWRNKKFDAAVARGLIKDHPKAVIAHDTCALKTFQTGKKIGVVCILDQVVGHIRAGSKLLKEECRLQPDFSDTLRLNDTEALEALCTAEALTADWILAPSDYVRQTLLDIGVPVARIVVLPYGVDVERFRPAPRRLNQPFRILFVGQIGQRKGIKYLLEAFKRLRLPNSELILMGKIAGSGIGLKAYEGLFRHVPNVPYAELHTYYNSADVFVFPSLHEGSALAVYEAMASGLPIITTPNSGSVVTDGVEGFLVPIRDVDALMQKISILHNNIELRQVMGQKARKTIESYTWKIYRQKLAALVRQWTLVT